MITELQNPKVTTTKMDQQSRRPSAKIVLQTNRKPSSKSSKRTTVSFIEAEARRSTSEGFYVFRRDWSGILVFGV
jgi:hypothetical protein